MYEKLSLPSLSQFRVVPRNIKLLGIHQLFQGFVPIITLHALMLSRVGGLNISQIGQLFAVWSLAYLVATLPSGVMADYWSRKNVIIIGDILRGAGFIIWLVWPSFWGYMCGFILWGCMLAFSDGADTAYLHNELQASGKDKSFAKYMGWVSALFWIGALAGMLLAALLTLGNVSLLIQLSATSSFASAITLSLATEHPYKRQSTYFKTLKAGFSEIARTKILQYVSFVLFSIYMVIGVVEEFLPRIYAQIGLNDTGVALTVALTTFLSITLLTKLESLVKASLSKQAAALSLGLMLLLVGLQISGILSVGLLLVFNLIFHLFRTVFYHNLQQATQGNERATIGSIPGLAGGLLGAGAFVIIGAMGQKSNEKAALGIYAIFWLLIISVLVVIGKKFSLKNKTT